MVYYPTSMLANYHYDVDPARRDRGAEWGAAKLLSKIPSKPPMFVVKWVVGLDKSTGSGNSDDGGWGTM
jgi:hypothetical protein